MHRMDFFEKGTSPLDRLAQFDYAPGEAQTFKFTSQPADAPIHVEAVTAVVVAIKWQGHEFEGYLGNIRLTMEYDGKVYPLAYDAYPRALEVRTDQVIHAPEFNSEHQKRLGYALSYTLPLARNQVFMIHPGMSATLHVTREIKTADVLKAKMRVLVGAELNGDLGIVSQRKRLLSRELNEYEKALIDV